MWRSRGKGPSLDPYASGANDHNVDEDTVMWARGIVYDSYTCCASRGLTSHHAEAKRIEDEINTVASKRCSMEDVQNLVKEVTVWSGVNVRYSGKGTAGPGGEFVVCPFWLWKSVGLTNGVGV